MAIDLTLGYVNVAYNSFSGGMDVNLPASSAAGDLIIAHLATSSTEDATLTGGTLIARVDPSSPGFYNHLYYKVLDASDVSHGHLHWTWSGSINCTASNKRITGHASSSIIGADVTSDSGYKVDFTCASITVEVDGAAVLQACSGYYGTYDWISDSDLTERNGASYQCFLGDIQASAGESGTKHITTAGEKCVLILFSINPAAGGASILPFVYSYLNQ